MAKIIFNDTIPFKGYKAMALWPWVFVRNECKERFTAIDSNHEAIHGEQQKEMLLVGFYLLYSIEWFIKLCYYRNSITAYKNISFEREAYANQNNVAYLDERKPYAFLKYINSNIN